MKDQPERRGTEGGVITDWLVVVSNSISIVEIKEIAISMRHTRMKPVFSSKGELMIIIPAQSADEASRKALELARRIVAAGQWGLDLLDLTDF
jgi:hypothetical protein